MNDAERVSGTEAAAYLDGHARERVDGDTAFARETRREWLATKQLHDQEEVAFCGLTDVEHLYDVGVPYLRRPPGLAYEARGCLGAVGERTDHFDGDLALQAEVGRAVHRAHPSLAEDRLEAKPPREHRR